MTGNEPQLPDFSHDRLSVKLGFDVDSMAKPKNMSDIVVLLNEAHREADHLGVLLKELGDELEKGDEHGSD